jgi:hypothetical protein
MDRPRSEGVNGRRLDDLRPVFFVSPVLSSGTLMPVTFSIGSDLVRATIVGDSSLTVPEFREFLSALISHPDFRPGLDILYDRRAVKSPPDDRFVRAALRAIGERADELRGCRWAVLISPKSALEVVRMTSLLGEQSAIEARPFVNLNDALHWLDHNESDAA